MSPRVLGSKMIIFALIGISCVSAQLLDWQEKYYGGVRALREGHAAAAKQALQEAYDYARSYPAESEWLARTAFGLGSLADMQGDYKTAERFEREAQTILETRPDRSPLLGLVFNGLGESLLEQARVDEAEKSFTRALEIFGSDPALKNAAVLTRRHLAEILFLRGDLSESEERLKTLIAEERKEPPSADLTGALNVLGRVYTAGQRWSEAEGVLREALERGYKAAGNELGVADTQVVMATVYRLEGHIERAEPLLRKSIQTYESRADTRVSGAYRQLALCRIAEHKYASARELLDKAIAVAVKAALPEMIVSTLKEDLAATDRSFVNARSARR